MHLAFLAFIAGNVVAAQCSFPIVSALPGMLLPLCCLGLGYAGSRIPAAAVLGGILVLATQQIELERRLPASGARLDVMLRGAVSSLPMHQGQATRFVFRVLEGKHAGSRYQLTWFRPDIAIRAGDRFTLHARLGPPSSAVNFDLFDYEKWLFSKRIHGRGYVLMSPGPQRETGACFFCVLQARAWLRSTLATVSSLDDGTEPPDSAVATQLALSLGDTSLLDQQDWQILNQTGTTHLLIVSGLHVGLIATLIYALSGLVGLGLPLRIACTLLVAFGYALLSGWGLPVQRAFLMTLAFFSASLLDRNIALTGRFVAALVVVLVFDPLASLSRGFWLSFGVVFALIVGLTRVQFNEAGFRLRVYNGARGVFISQWVAYLALLPLIGFYTQTLPIGSLLTNLVAIPWVSLLIVPVTLAALVASIVSDSLSALLLMISSVLIQGLWWFLRFIDNLKLILPVTVYSIPMLIFALTGVCILLLPRALVARWPGLLLMLLAFSQRQPADQSPLVLTFLDVGQGLSVLVETPHGAVLYDTGPAYPGGYSAATQALLPTLRGRGHGVLQALIVSHSDLDHAGGVDAIIDGIAVRRVIQYGDCYSRWQSGEVMFESFDLAQPISGSGVHRVSDNASSCLLRVSLGTHQILLTGDIEAAEEYRLLGQYQHHIGRSLWTLLLVPHHGSASSSTPALLNRLLPDVAIISAGYQNRFGHPVEAVVARYKARGIRVFNTAEAGAIRVSFDAVNAPGVDTTPRITTARGQPAGVWRRR